MHDLMWVLTYGIKIILECTHSSKRAAVSHTAAPLHILNMGAIAIILTDSCQLRLL